MAAAKSLVERGAGVVGAAAKGARHGGGVELGEGDRRRGDGECGASGVGGGAGGDVWRGVVSVGLGGRFELEGGEDGGGGGRGLGFEDGGRAGGGCEEGRQKGGLVVVVLESVCLGG